MKIDQNYTNLVKNYKNCTFLYIIFVKNRLWWTPEYQLRI